MLKLSKVTTIVLWALMVISVLFLILYSGTKSISEEPFIIWSYVLIVAAVALAVGFPIVNAIANPKGLKGMVIGLVSIGIILAISYALASDEIMTNVSIENETNPAGLMKYAGTSIITTYLLLGVAVISVIYAEVSKSFK